MEFETLMEDFGEFNRELFKEKFCKSDEQISAAEKTIGCGIDEFYDYYINNYYEKLDEIVDKLKNEQLNILSKAQWVNSVKVRVKDPYHVIDKLVRKTIQNNDYTNVKKDNLHLFFDDLIGCRLIILYYEDWSNVHKEICKLFPYSHNCNKVKPRVDEKVGTPCIIHPVEINIRNGDDEEIFKAYISSNPEEKLKLELRRGRYYRSIHYTIAYDSSYSFELQVRSIYDEAWGEVDHDVLYPKHLENKELTGYSKMLNRITGASNEMSSYFKNVLCKAFSGSFVSEPTLNTVPNEIMLHSSMIENKDNANLSEVRSIKNIIDNITNGDII